MANTSTNVAIIYARNELHNSKALSKDNFLDLGSTENAYNNWVAYVTELRKAVYNYNYVTDSTDPVKAFKALGLTSKAKELTDAKAIQIVEAAVLATWRDVAKQVAGDEFNNNFFVRKSDISKICGFCGTSAVNTAKGPEYSTKTITEFRKNIERHIGIRMAGNGMLTDEARDILTTYEKAVLLIKASKAALADGKDNNGKTVLGLESSLTYEQNVLKEMIEKLNAIGVTDEKAIAEFTEAQQAKVDKLSETIDGVKKRLAKAEKAKADSEEEYNKTIALLHSLGDDYE